MTPRRVWVFTLTTPLVPTARPHDPSVIVAMRPVREYSFCRGQIGSCALGFVVPGSAVDGAHMIERHGIRTTLREQPTPFFN